ncbi:hypothetical protein [Paraburkholderia sp. SIMBA_054]|uniref:hypothetical protein n=1 Tax=Paraburkholderia sp. SIMBA_054 TaxID=3085795 RepID=UPI00397DE862
MALYWQGKATKLTTFVPEADAPARPAALAVDWLVNERCDTLVIEGHIDLAVASGAMQRESRGYKFPAPRHAWMRYMATPDGELDESEQRHGWRGECQRGDRGAEPVTIAVRIT